MGADVSVSSMALFKIQNLKNKSKARWLAELLILAVLFYLAYRLLRNAFEKKSDSQQSAGRSPGPNERLTDVLVEDPVCKTLVPREQAVRLEKNGETYYFCSQECCNKFASEKGDTA